MRLTKVHHLDTTEKMTRWTCKTVIDRSYDLASRWHHQFTRRIEMVAGMAPHFKARGLDYPFQDHNLNASPSRGQQGCRLSIAIPAAKPVEQGIVKSRHTTIDGIDLQMFVNRTRQMHRFKAKGAKQVVLLRPEHLLVGETLRASGQLADTELPNLVGLACLDPVWDDPEHGARALRIYIRGKVFFVQ